MKAFLNQFFTLAYKNEILCLKFIVAASRSVIPFISTIPMELQKEFMDDFVRLAISFNNETTPDGVIVEMPYQFLVAYACKKSE